MPPKPIRIEPGDIAILSGLRQNEKPFEPVAYEFSILEMLEVIEQLLDSITKGPDLPLVWMDEFGAAVKTEGQYKLYRNRRVGRIVESLQQLRKVIELIPPHCLSPRVQAFYRIFWDPAYSDCRETSLDPEVEKVWETTINIGNRVPATRFDYRDFVPDMRWEFSQEQAMRLIDMLTPYYDCLKAVLKHPDLKLAHNNRLKQARDHYQSLTSLFRATCKTYPEVLLVYLELSVPAAKGEDTAAPESYIHLNKAKAEFLKDRQHTRLFHGLACYAWKYRYTRDRGLVCVMILLFDYTEQTQLYALTQALTERWRSVAPEGGQCWSPSPTARPQSYQYYGRLDCTEKAVKDGFAALARLMGLYGAYVQPRPPKNLRVFGTSKLPGVKSRPKKKSRTGTKNKKNQSNTEAKS